MYGAERNVLDNPRLQRLSTGFSNKHPRVQINLMGRQGVQDQPLRPADARSWVNAVTVLMRTTGGHSGGVFMRLVLGFTMWIFCNFNAAFVNPLVQLPGAAYFQTMSRNVAMGRGHVEFLSNICDSGPNSLMGLLCIIIAAGMPDTAQFCSGQRRLWDNLLKHPRHPAIESTHRFQTFEFAVYTLEHFGLVNAKAVLNPSSAEEIMQRLGLSLKERCIIHST